MRICRLAAIGVVSVVALAACGSDSDESGSVDTQAPAVAASSPSTEPAADTVAPIDAAPADTAPADTAPADTGAGTPTDGGGLQLLDTELGGVVGDSDGFTVYLFMPDAQGDSTCYDECEANWPFVAEVTAVGDGLDAALLGTTERTTGDIQATYNGWPLYSFGGDAGPGETSGQGVGGVWFALDASGAPIES